MTAAEFTVMLVEVTGLDAAAITPAARLDGELRVDSLEIVALGEALRDRYGDRVDLTGHLAGLELDELIALTVADVLSYLDSAGAR